MLYEIYFTEEKKAVSSWGIPKTKIIRSLVIKKKNKKEMRTFYEEHIGTVLEYLGINYFEKIEMELTEKQLVYLEYIRSPFRKIK